MNYNELDFQGISAERQWDVLLLSLPWLSVSAQQ